MLITVEYFLLIKASLLGLSLAKALLLLTYLKVIKIVVLFICSMFLILH